VQAAVAPFLRPVHASSDHGGSVFSRAANLVAKPVESGIQKVAGGVGCFASNLNSSLQGYGNACSTETGVANVTQGTNLAVRIFIGDPTNPADLAMMLPVFRPLRGLRYANDAIHAGGATVRAERAGTRTFHRLESPTQTSVTASKQERSGEIWGRPNRGSAVPSVDAYQGPLSPGARGVEFTTDVPPNPWSPPGRARWYGDRPGVRNEGGYAKICGRVTKNTQC
jgi:hypothetical protein